MSVGGWWLLKGEVFILSVASLLTLGAPLGIDDLVKCNPLISIFIIVKFVMIPSWIISQWCSDTSSSTSQSRSAWNWALLTTSWGGKAAFCTSLTICGQRMQNLVLAGGKNCHWWLRPNEGNLVSTASCQIATTLLLPNILTIVIVRISCTQIYQMVLRNQYFYKKGRCMMKQMANGKWQPAFMARVHRYQQKLQELPTGCKTQSNY